MAESFDCRKSLVTEWDSKKIAQMEPTDGPSQNKPISCSWKPYALIVEIIQMTSLRLKVCCFLVSKVSLCCTCMTALELCTRFSKGFQIQASCDFSGIRHTIIIICFWVLSFVGQKTNSEFTIRHSPQYLKEKHTVFYWNIPLKCFLSVKLAERHARTNKSLYISYRRKHFTCSYSISPNSN